MKRFAFLFAFLFLFSAASAFSIVSYETNSVVLTNGDLNVYEKMVFDLDEVYNEGYRSIRPEDFDYLSSIIVHSVELNGENVPYEKTMNGNYAEIIWKKTVLGENVVELNYTLKDRVELYDDFARICYEHYGANWPVVAQEFSSRMSLPEETRGRTMHFEVYSRKKGEAYVDDLSIVIEMDDVPSGNYIGGCYLFFKGAVNTTKTVPGSAYEILKSEREEFGSEAVLEPEFEPVVCLSFFFVIFLVFFFSALSVYVKNKKQVKYPENILPPEKEEPSVISVLMRNELSKKDIMAAAILRLISRGVIDIVELEKKGKKGAELKKERTILMLKKKDAKLEHYEKTLIEMLFEKGDEIDLDAMAEEFEKVKTKNDAKKLGITSRLDRFYGQIESILRNRGIYHLTTQKKEKIISMVILCIVVLMASLPFSVFIIEVANTLLADENFVSFSVFAGSIFGIALSMIYLFADFMKPEVPKEMKDKFAKWDGFVRAVKSSRLKEYPPASAVIWDDIIVYATALGLTDKVKKHLSELKAFDIRKIEKIERVRASAFTYYAAAYAVSNLSKYGSRSGPVSRSSGGFSSFSSGGWSGGGGGGFSGGSSGGGGFR